MIIALTGTPGVGKTEVGKLLSKSGYDVKSANQLAEDLNCIIGEEGGSLVVDIYSLKDKIERSEGKITIIEGHLAHHLNPDKVIVLRCNPKTLKKRLSKKGWKKDKILENLEAEITDVILMESLGNNEVYEIDTTEMAAEEVSKAVADIIEGNIKEGEYKVGSIDWIFELGDEMESFTRKF